MDFQESNSNFFLLKNNPFNSQKNEITSKCLFEEFLFLSVQLHAEFRSFVPKQKIAYNWKQVSISTAFGLFMHFYNINIKLHLKVVKRENLKSMPDTFCSRNIFNVHTGRGLLQSLL